MFTLFGILFFLISVTMVGIGPLESELRGMLPPNVELRTWVSREELAELYATSCGFIHVGEEDFGITMVEAMASGTPVIALDGGGACHPAPVGDPWAGPGGARPARQLRLAAPRCER